MSTIISEGYPILFIGVCPSSISEGCPQMKQTSLFWEAIFIHGTSMCEGVDEDLRHGTGHVDIQVGTCIILLEYVCGYHCMNT